MASHGTPRASSADGTRGAVDAGWELRLASAAVDTGRALETLRTERRRLWHSPAGASAVRVEETEKRARTQSALFAAVVRLGAEEQMRRKVDLRSAMSALRRIAATALGDSYVAEAVHDVVLAEVSTACIYAYYSDAYQR